jgi:hypothetical protein
MFRILIDTCVWLDLAKDYKQKALLDALEQLVQLNQISLILPQTILDEFGRNRTRVIEESRQSLSTTMKRVKEVVEKFGDPKGKNVVLEHLNDVDRRLPGLGENAIEAVGRVERLFKVTPVIEISEAVKLRAAQRAIDGRAPFHRQKNSMNDALLIEVYSDLLQSDDAKGVRFAFVTHNIKDFSTTAGDSRLPHPDIAMVFSKIKSLYLTSLGVALKRIEPALITDLMIEQEWEQEPRRLTEILKAIDLLYHQVWYNRHQIWKERIAEGKIKIVEKETFPVKDHATVLFKGTSGKER